VEVMWNETSRKHTRLESSPNDQEKEEGSKTLNWNWSE